MNVVVCVKQVPDIEGRIVVEEGAVTFQDSNAREVINPLDLLAIEEALRIKEKDGQGKVTLFCVGDTSSEESLRKGIAMGADEAILLSDSTFDNGDSYATALVLAKAISTIPHDLVLCGRRADDTQAGLVGSYVAHMLGLPLIQGVIDVIVDSEAKKLVVQRKLERGDREVVEGPIPALLTVETGLNYPRHLTVQGIFKTRKKEIPKRDSPQLGLSAEEVGLTGSKAQITHISPPKPKMKGLIIPDSKLSPAERLKLIAGGGLVPRQSGLLEGDPAAVASKLIQYFKDKKIVSGS
jgi:electron transfer flavoprotein beta subunit